jgi:hypothetical protein
MHSSRRRVGVVAALMGLCLALSGCGTADVTPKSAAPGGADPVAWMGAFCAGLGEVIAAEAAAAKPPSTPQGQKDALLTLADTTNRLLLKPLKNSPSLASRGSPTGNRLRTAQ